MRVAETRAVNRALRKAYGIAICSVEEMGTKLSNSKPAPGWKPELPRSESHNGNAYPLRDRLLLLVRQHGLDARLVKQYAIQFCGVPELRQVTRERLQEFIEHLSAEAVTNGAALRQKLESISQ